MAEDLQYLIDRIQKEAVNKAEAEAENILTKARAQADEIVRGAENEARAKLEKADKDATVYAERSTRALEQAARDMLISVGRRFEKMVSDIIALQVEKNLTDSTIKEMLLTLAKGYSSDTELSVSDADKEKLTAFAVGEFAKALEAGVTVQSDSGIKYGFRLSFENGTVSHEFTAPAIAASLSALVRPQIAKIVSDVAQGK